MRVINELDPDEFVLKHFPGVALEGKPHLVLKQLFDFLSSEVEKYWYGQACMSTGICSKKRVLVRIDDAEDFLRALPYHERSKNMQVFLEYTSNNSDKFAILAATSKLDKIEPAAADRFASLIYFPLPGADERRRLFNFYLHQSILMEHDANQMEKLNDDFSILLKPFDWNSSPIRLSREVMCELEALEECDDNKNDEESFIKFSEGMSGRSIKSIAELAVSQAAEEYYSEGGHRFITRSNLRQNIIERRQQESEIGRQFKEAEDERRQIAREKIGYGYSDSSLLSQ